MAAKKPTLSRSKKNIGRKGKKNVHTTKSGKTFKINTNLIDKFKARKAKNAQKRAERLIGMPKSRFKRVLWRMHPRQMYKYWFSREGAIMALKISGIGILASFLLLVGIFAYFRKDLPNITDVSGNNIGGSIQYYDRTGKVLLWEDFDAVKRIPISDEEMSVHIKNATVAIEDKDFFHHGGFDVRGITRAGVSNVLGRGGTQGGSTITQQLIKLTQNWTDERTYTRKVKELILAVQLEREYSKDQILTGYLNTAPYGNIEYGVQAASNNYFQKDAKDLTIAESAFLAAIPKSPSIYSPYGAYYDKPSLVGRYMHILDQMQSQGYITEEEANSAKEVDILATIKPQQPKYSGIKSPYFVLAAKSELDTRYGAELVNRGGWKVLTTLDTKLQKYAEDAIKDNVPTINRYGADVSAFVAEDVETGQIVSQVGGVDFNNKEHGKINYAHNAYIPPGSSFKPYDYAALIEYSDNAGAGSVLYDQRDPLPGYPCTNKGLPPPRGQGNCLQNYDFRYPGPMTLRYALGGSRNVPAVKANLIVGTDKVIDMANSMMYNPNNPKTYQCYEPGDETFTQVTPCYGASAIGDGAFLHLDDHVNGLATFARLGEAIPRTYILKITDAASKNVYEYEKPRSEQVIRPDTAYIVNDMAADPNASYLPYSYKFHNYNGWRFAIKTGTTNNGFDGLMASWSGKYATISWVGHHTRNKELTGAMELMTTPITRTWMEKAHQDLEPSPKTDIYPSWYQAPKSSDKSQRIDIISNKRATECTPEAAIKETKGNNSNTFSVDIFVDKAADTEQQDDVHKCSDVKPSVTIVKNGDGEVNCSKTCTVSARITKGTHALSSDKYKGTVTFSIDGSTINSQSVHGNGVVSFTYKPNFNGSKTLSVQIVDSVLYQGADTAKIIAEMSNSSSFKIEKAEQNGVKAYFEWSGSWSGKVTIRRLSDNAIICESDNGNDNDCEEAGLYEGDEVYAIDSSGTRSENNKKVKN
jgi:membrane peptidoglycan carboxypeptidase